MAYNPGNYLYQLPAGGGMNAVSPQQFGQMAQRQARPMTNAPGYFGPSVGTGGGAPTLSSFRNMSPDQLLRLRLQYRLAEQEPALTQRQREAEMQNQQFGQQLAQQQSQFETTSGLDRDRFIESMRQFGMTFDQAASEFDRRMAQQDQQFGANLGFQYNQLGSQNLWNQLNSYYNLLGRFYP